MLWPLAFSKFLFTMGPAHTWSGVSLKISTFYTTVFHGIGTAVTNFFAKEIPMKFDKFGSNYSMVLIMGISDFHGHTAR